VLAHLVWRRGRDGVGHGGLYIRSAQGWRLTPSVGLAR
jgi:hypothetical protein